MLEAQQLGVALAAVLGLAIGSFLNVVIHRLPKMLERQWADECAELAGISSHQSDQPRLGLTSPRSRCGSCGHQIGWHENIPVFSYLFLRGKCSSCGALIGIRYPMVELATAALFAFCAAKWGPTPTAVSWATFCAALLCLTFIDWDTTFLPDDITLPLLWGGLIASALQYTAMPLSMSLWGAVAGYLSLWSVYWAFKLLTGKEGMGYGDFKLLAALGAWFGWQALIPIILMASVIGAIVGIGMKFSGGLREGGYVPFGPFLAGAGFVTLLFGPQAVLGLVSL